MNKLESVTQSGRHSGRRWKKMEEDGRRWKKMEEDDGKFKVAGDGLGTLVGVPIDQKNKSDLGYDFFLPIFLRN